MLACPSIYLYSRTQGKIEEQNTFETIYGVPEGDVKMFNSCNSTGRSKSLNTKPKSFMI